MKRARHIVATPGRSVCDDNARALAQEGALRALLLGTRHGTRGVPVERTRLFPVFGLLNFAGAKLLSPYRSESLRFGLLPLFDWWVKRQLEPGDCILSSYGYANESFKWVRRHGGTTFVDAGNSHPENFWEILAEEHRRWKCPLPPVAPHWNRRSIEMMPLVDYVLSPSQYVTCSFLERGFPADRILRNVYPIDLACFAPPAEPRSQGRPLRVICTSQLSLRKGTPYLLEAFRIVLKSEPGARLLLTDNVADSVRPILARYHDLPIDWAPGLPHPQLAERLRSADIFVLPSLEEGLARTSIEALACGLPAIVTPNTGTSDFIVPGRNGEVVPIRDAQAMADAVLAWWERIRAGSGSATQFDRSRFSYETFAREYIGQLRDRGLLE